MKHMFRQCLIVIVLLYGSISFAQKKVLPGFYISQQGDTVKGIFPAYTQWNRNPAQVEFSAAAASKPTLLTPQNCRKFVVEGYDEYLSYSGQRLTEPIEDQDAINNLSADHQTEAVENVTVFLRLVTNTQEVALYSFKDAKRVNFFYQLPGQPITELRFKKVFERNTIIEYAEYRQQLGSAFQDRVAEKNLTASLEKLSYSEEELTEFLQSLFPSKKENRRRKDLAEGWVLSGGVSVNKVNTDGDQNLTYFPSRYNTSVTPLLSVGYYSPASRNFGRFFIYPQLKLFRYQNTGEVSAGSYIKSITFKASLVGTLELDGGVNIINQENFRFFIAAGAGILTQIKGVQSTQLYNPSDHSTWGTPSETSIVPLSYQFNASAGIVLNKRYQITATYMTPTWIAKYIFFRPKLSSVQLRLGYRL